METPPDQREREREQYYGEQLSEKHFVRVILGGRREWLRWVGVAGDGGFGGTVAWVRCIGGWFYNGQMIKTFY